MPFERALLEHRPVFHSSDVDETRAFLNPFGLRFDPVEAKVPTLDVRLNGVFFPGIYIGYVQYGSPALVRMDPDASYSIKLPTRGQLEAGSRDDIVSCDVRRGVVLSPTRRHVLRSQSGSARVNIALKQDALRQQLMALLGAEPAGPLEFAAPLSLRDGHGQSLARFARLAIAELERTDTILLDPMTVRAFREFVATALLLHQPHNYAETLRRLERPVTPRDVKRAIEYMQANLDAAIGLAEIVAASGIPGRTLLQHFRNFKGTSPMRYLRAARYERAREALRHAEPEENITAIAARWGFTHMGRFSGEYRRRFGESPSETLRQRRADPSHTGGPSWFGRIHRLL